MNWKREETEKRKKKKKPQQIPLEPGVPPLPNTNTTTTQKVLT